MWKRGLKNRKNIIIFVSILLVSFALMTVNIKRSQNPTIFETTFLWVVAPIQSFFTLSVNSVAETLDEYFFLVETSRENVDLKQQVDLLTRENNGLKEEVRRLHRLEHLMEYQDRHELKFTVASVIGRDATQWVKMVFINKGTQDGIRENQPVVTNAGIVGHIVQAGVSTSKVLLIIDSRSAVDALFQESRVPGVIVGGGTDSCKMKYVPITAEVKVGDPVLSSGLGGIYPKGLMVGRVTEVIKGRQGLFQDIVISPSADLTRLEEVLVLLS